MKKKIFYWAPCLNKVGTVISSLNSALAMSKYEKKQYDIYMINVFGEWNEHEKILKTNGVKIINLTFGYYNLLPKTGFILSRFSYWIIFFVSFFPLLFLLKKKQPDFIILHLITSLPLTLMNIFSLKTNFILRISGYPKLNFLRKYIWKFSMKKIYRITCPTNELISELEYKQPFLKGKLAYLSDAILNFDTIKKKPNTLNDNSEKIILAAGRLTRQKNFIYLISEFKEFVNIYKNYKLIILGDGELKSEIKMYIKEHNLENRVNLKGRVENVYEYMKNSKVFVLSSLWEELGFVIVEAAFNNLYVISSDCKNGPSEFLDYGKNGIIFKSNKEGKLLDALIKFHKETDEKKFLKKILAKKMSSKYTKFRHCKILNKIISDKI